MGVTVEVLYPIVVKNAERQSRLLVDPLRVFSHMSLFLYSFELPKQKYRSIFDRMSLAIFFSLFRFFLDDVSKDGVVDRQTVNVIELLD